MLLSRGRGSYREGGADRDFFLTSELRCHLGGWANLETSRVEIGAVQGWYPRCGTCARRKRGVERRGDRLSEEYKRPLATLDNRYHGTPVGQVGPLVKRLESYGQLLGLVMESFQEGSKDIHYLLDILADSQLKAMVLARGREGSD